MKAAYREVSNAKEVVDLLASGGALQFTPFADIGIEDDDGWAPPTYFSKSNPEEAMRRGFRYRTTEPSK